MNKNEDSSTKSSVQSRPSLKTHPNFNNNDAWKLKVYRHLLCISIIRFCSKFNRIRRIKLFGLRLVVRRLAEGKLLQKSPRGSEATYMENESGAKFSASRFRLQGNVLL